AASRVAPRRRDGDIRPTVEKAAELLYDDGALPEELDRIIELVTVKNHLSQGTQATLVRNMYPVGNIPDEVVLRIIGSLGEGRRKPSTGVQVLLLKFLVMVYHLIEKPEVLSQSYSTLFNLLDQVDLRRPHLCQLLALVTRRKHVKPHRYPNREWRAKLEEIRQKHLARGTGGSEQPQNGFTVKRPIGRGAKRNLPAVHTFQRQKNSIALEDINDARGLARNLERIELPSQLVAVLGDPLLQKLLRLRPAEEAHERVSNWVRACVQDVASGDASQSLLLDMIDIIYEFVRSTKTLPPLFFQLFRELFKVWDGKTKDILILDILGFCPLMNFAGITNPSEDLYETVLQPLESAVLDNSTRSQLHLLKFYKTLLQRWGIVILSAEDVSSLPTDAVSELMRHTDGLALTIAQSSSTSSHLAILDFYERAAALFLDPALLPHLEITAPSALLVYLLHFDHSLAVASRLYTIVAAYKQAMAAVSKTRGFTGSERLLIATINGFTTDIVNSIWRGKALDIADKAAKGCLVPQDILPSLNTYLRTTELGVQLSALFGLSYSPALCLQSTLYIQKLEDDEMRTSELELHARHAGPVTKLSLARLASEGGLALNLHVYKAGALQFLEEKGFAGVGELMYSTLPKTLRRPGLSSQDESTSQLSSQLSV
ncbi:Mis6-domain-containing protein, partial [Thozetella sp. PMI_491]